MVNKLLKNGTSLIFQRQTTILSAAGVLMVMAIGGALLSVAKIHFLSGLLDPSSKADLDAYTAAFRVPDLVFNMLVIGSLNAAFIPVFGQLVQKGKDKESWQILSSMMNGSLMIFGLLAVVMLLFSHQFAQLIAPKFSPEQIELTARLTELLVISPLLLGVSAFITGAIQVHHRFFIPALAPILYNVGAIIGIKWLYPIYGVYGLVYGVIIGSVLHVLIQLPLLYALGYRYDFLIDWRNQAVKRISKLTIPRSVGLGVDQLELLMATALLSTLASGGMFLFGRVQNLIAFPISFFGVSIAQAALPTLAKEIHEDVGFFRQTLLTTFHQILYLVVPITVLMVVLRLPIIRVLMNLDDWTSTLESASLLLWFAPAILAQSAIHLWARASYALEDSVSPLMAGAVGVVISILLAVSTVGPLGMRGIALGMVVGGFVNVALLIYFVNRKIGGFGWSNLYVPMLRIGVAGAVMAAAVYWPVKPMESALFDTSKTVDLLMLCAVVAGFGSSLYLFISWILGSQEIGMFIKVAHKLRSWREAFMKFPTTYNPATSSVSVREQSIDE